MPEYLVSILLFASIPISSGLVGWGTNVMAIKMTFYPIEFVGIRPVGWQGIIPSKAKKMAVKSVDMLTSKLLKIEERFGLVKPERVAAEMGPSLDKLARQITDEVMQAQAPTIWKSTPKFVKNQVYENITKELPQLVVQMMNDIKDNINDLLDLKTIGVTALTKNKALLNDMFIRCGKEEFKFIEKSGIYFGIPFGLIQMGLAIYFVNVMKIGTPWWLLPLFGLIVGYATNWLALKLIFEPLYPRKYLFGLFEFQGLFIKRQPEVAVEYAKIVSGDILTTERLFEFMVRGPGATHLAEIVRDNLEKSIDTTISSTRGLVKWVVSDKQLEVIKNIAVYRFMQEIPISIRDTFAYAEEALDMENMLEEKMAGLTEKEFEGFLRPVFQEDEWILIMVGAVLGMLAGILQYVLLFR